MSDNTTGPWRVGRSWDIHKACVEHWEGIMGVLGRQHSWEGDAMRIES